MPLPLFLLLHNYRLLQRWLLWFLVSLSCRWRLLCLLPLLRLLLMLRLLQLMSVSLLLHVLQMLYELLVRHRLQLFVVFGKLLEPPKLFLQFVVQHIATRCKSEPPAAGPSLRLRQQQLLLLRRDTALHEQ